MRRQLHCEAHAVAGEVNLIEHACAQCGIMNIIHPVSKMCGYCDPAQTVYRPVKRKELEIKAVLATAGWTPVHDRRLDDACGLKDRPDFVIDAGFCYLVIEVDEDQHQSYMCARTCTCPSASRHCQCQQARMLDMGQTMGMPQVWIRYNPDKFVLSNKHVGKHGPPKRQQELIRVIKHVQDQGPDGLAGAYTRVCYMYYDGGDDMIQWDTLA